MLWKAAVSARFRAHSVLVEMTPYHLTKGRIIYRFQMIEGPASWGRNTRPATS